ncbi:MAG: AAA family ATPase [Nitrososphaeria archaeon]
MRITKLRLENFLSFDVLSFDKNKKNKDDEEWLELGDLTILVGPNGAGKTNVLRALRLLGDLAESLAAPDPRYFKDPSKLLRISAEVEVVDNGERELVRDFLRLLVARDIPKMLYTEHTEEPALQELVGSLVAPGGPLDEITLEPSGVTLECEPPTPIGIKKCRRIFKFRLRAPDGALYGELCRDTGDPSAGLLSDCGRPYAPRTGGPTSIADIVIQRLKESGIIKDKGPAGQELPWPPGRMVEVLREKLGSPMRLGLADALLEELNRAARILISYKDDLELSFIDDKARRPGSLGEASRRLLEGLRRIGYPINSNVVINLESLIGSLLAHSVIVLEQLRGPVPEAIDIGDLNASGATRSLGVKEVMRALAELSFTGKFSDERALGILRCSMFNMIGLMPKLYLDTVRPKPTMEEVFRRIGSEQNRQESEVEKQIPMVKLKFLECKPGSSESGEKLKDFSECLKYPLGFERGLECDRELPPDLVPAGAIELLSVLTAIVAARGGVLLLDEPGQNLHPTMQVELLRAIGKLALEQGTQVVIVTHSPYMLDPELIINKGDKVRVYRISRACGSSKIHAPFEGEDSEERVEILTRLQKNPDFKAALFSSAAVVVEGYGELVFLEALRGRGLLSEYEPLAIVYGEGKGSVGKYLRWLEGFGVPALAFCDNDCLGELPDDLKQRAITVNKYDLGVYIHEKFGDKCQCELVKDSNKPDKEKCKDSNSKESCKNPEKIHELVMEADEELLKNMVKELGLERRLGEILDAQTKCPEGAAAGISTPASTDP